VICAWLTCEEPPAWATRWLIDPIIEEGRLSSLPSAAEMQRRLDRVGFKRVAVENLSSGVQRTWGVVIKRVLGGLLHRADYRRYLLDRAQQNRRFAMALLYLWIGYRIGVMRYGLFAVRKPNGERTPT
jgi:tocopherol O-methyltransferase